MYNYARVNNELSVRDQLSSVKRILSVKFSFYFFESELFFHIDKLFEEMGFSHLI